MSYDPFPEKYETEALACGFTLLKITGYPTNYRFYKCHKCLTDGLFQTTHMRRNNIICPICLENEIKAEAESNNFTFISRNTQGEKHTYINKRCGHTLIAKRQAIKGSTGLFCEVCRLDEILRVCQEDNLTFMDTKPYTVVFKYNSCSHIKEVKLSAFHAKRHICKQCLWDAKKVEVAKLGHTFIDFLDDYKVKVNLSCGHEKSVTFDHLKNNAWVCHSCGDTAYNTESSIYLFKIRARGFSWLKLGFSKNKENRIKSYGLPNGYSYEVIKTINFETGEQARLKEISIHGKYKENKLCRKLMKNYHSNNGNTECYPLSMLDTLVKELDDE